MMQDIFAKHLGLPEGNVRVICKDVGGSLRHQGARLSRRDGDGGARRSMLRRPVKFVADRLEIASSPTSTPATTASRRASPCTQGGRHHRLRHRRPDRHRPLLGLSAHQRASRATRSSTSIGGPYTLPATTAPAPRVVFQNKTSTCQYRAVGHPIACAVTEGHRRPRRRRRSAWIPVEFRRRNLIARRRLPVHLAVRHQVRGAVAPRSSLDKLLDHDGLRRACAPSRRRLREKGIHRGIGFASFIEVTNPSRRLLRRRRRAHLRAGRRTVRLEPTGTVRAASERHRAGPGHRGDHRADRRERGRRADRAACASSPATPTSRPTAAAPGPRAAPASAARRRCRPARRCARTSLEVAGAMLQAAPKRSTSVDGEIVDARHRPRAHAARRARAASPTSAPDTLPPDFPPSSIADAPLHRRSEYPFAFTNGIQASLARGRRRHRLRQAAEALVRRGLRHASSTRCWSTSRSAAASCRASARALTSTASTTTDGQLLNGTMADYLVPMAAEMPDIEVGHVETPTTESRARRQGRRRGRHRRRAGRGDERHQRRARAARRAHHRHADHAGARAARAREGLLITSPRASFKA